MLYAAKSHIGLVRSMNQDGYIIVPGLNMGNLYLVADGMGGPSAGDVASRLAVTHIRDYFEHLEEPSTPSAEALLTAIRTANAEIFRNANENPAYQGMGTTIVCALADHEQVHFAHVGDSRAYMLSGDNFRQVTRDHSLVAELVRRGQLTREEAKHHPQRNIVTRSLGTESYSAPDIDRLEWAPGDVILLCSDGLTNLVEDEELATHLASARACENEAQLNQVVDDLIQCALDRGGTDNVTALIAIYREERGDL